MFLDSSVRYVASRACLVAAHLNLGAARAGVRASLRFGEPRDGDAFDAERSRVVDEGVRLLATLDEAGQR